MINIKQAKRYCCEDISLIENYEKAINDNSQVWDIHHKLGIEYTTKELIKMNMYFNVKSNDLIFLTRKEHKLLHKDRKGKKWTKEQQIKFSNTMKGRSVWNSGKTNIYSEETLIKLRKHKRKYKWLTSTGEIKIMDYNHANRWHPDWKLIGEV